MNQGTNLGSQIGRWIILAAVVALLGALLLTIRPVGAQTPAETVFDHNENDTGAITTYSSTDPEGNTIFWTLGGADAADFTIDGGSLRFKNAPNYEVPTDRANDENGVVDDPVIDNEGLANNVYKVTVRDGGGGEDGAPGDDDYAGDDLDEEELTVNVININEPGMLVISPRQPQVGTELTAILTDEDNVAPGVGEWQWARSASMTGFTDIPNLSTDMTYSPTIDDLNMYLRVTVVYVDRAGRDPRNLQGVSEFKVREDTVTSNQPPKFPDQSTLIGGNSPSLGTPTDGRMDTDRFIPETAAAGDPVGARVTAFDDATEIEEITYSLRDPVGTAANGAEFDDDEDTYTLSASDGHAASFDIHATTGQITVSASAMLNADGESPINPYTVVVRAVDGDGDDENITVTIYVLPQGEPPTIDRVYVADRVTAPHVAGDRVPTEMTHYELDRLNTPATVIDTDLDTATPIVEPAAYAATDPEEGTITWSLDGPDAGMFVITGSVIVDGEATNTGPMATLAFESGPDWEEEGDENEDNVYEVTIVATDNEGLSDELNVTVKVINSTEDNAAGTVTFTNRQPEVATELTAMLADADGPIERTIKWQWYRTVDNDLADNEAEEIRPVCDPRDPEDGLADGVDTVDQRRHFVENDDPGGTAWEEITGATLDTYTPVQVLNADDEVIEEDSDIGRCLRATVSYEDGVDPTQVADDDSTNKVNEALEGTWAATEHPVKAIDEQNKEPVFTDDGDFDVATVSSYTQSVEENSLVVVPITEAFPAADEFEREDDTVDDLLTYSLTYHPIEDEDSPFTITGTLADLTPTTPTDDGDLTIAAGLDYEEQRKYRVTIRATDPSGEYNEVEVIVNVTNVNERPDWHEDEGGAVSTTYEENDTAEVSTYHALDPEESGITYSLVAVAITADEALGIQAVSPEDIEDRALFEIGSISGELRFKESPNFEDPQDTGTNNVYQVAVRAEVTDNERPRHFTTRVVTVRVTNVNEAPVFSEDTDTLEISENPDDPQKEPDGYLVNRGVGIPAANFPAAPNLDFGIPMVAQDDDNTFTTQDYTGNANADTGREQNPIQLIDGLTYKLSGADAAHFDIVPATGQILTKKKLDHETEREYNVTVTATDPFKLSGSIALTIEVTDVDEEPVSKPTGISIAGLSSPTYAENETVPVETYSAHGENAASAVWTLEGVDSGEFSIDRSGESSMLRFRSTPNFEAPTDDDENNTYIITVKAAVGGFADSQDVTVTVSNVAELGTLEGMASISYPEDSPGPVGTYSVSGVDAAMATWTLEGEDSGNFSIGGPGASSMLTFQSAPDHENPADSDNNNIYMVTVKAEVGSETDSKDVTVTVTNVSELGLLEGMASITYAENDTDAVDTYFVSGGGSATWTLEGADSGVFSIGDSGASRMLGFMSAPDYEAPADDGTDNTYLVTIRVDGGGEMATLDITVIVTNEEEDGSVVLSLTSPAVDDAVTAVLTDPDGGITNVIWLWETSPDMVTWSTATGAVTTVGALSIYTIVEDDVDDYLRATASYEDGHDASNSEVSQLAMVVATRVNVPPAFPNEAEMRSIPENTAAGTDIGDPVAATDENGDTLTYILSGTDAASFSIGLNTGQLSTLAALNYETKNTYNVVVTATDPDGESATINVTINVTNVDEGVPAIVERYDTDTESGIQIDELFKAIDDYFAGGIITIDQLFQVIDAYFE